MIHAAAFSPDGKMLITANSDGTARLWDAGTGAEVGHLGVHTGHVTFADFGAGGTLAITADDDGMIHVWDVVTGAEVRRLEGRAVQFLSASFGPDSRSILTVSHGGTIRLWSISVEDLLARAVSLIQRDPPTLTTEETRRYELNE